MSNDTPSPAAAPINAIVPMIHVLDMDRSVSFYRLLGFEIGNYVPREGPIHWAWLYSPKASSWKRGPNLMLTRSECAIEPEEQRFLFYLYAADLKGLRKTLQDAGIKVGDVEYPEYLPEGEFQVLDPDGFTLMIAQAGERTP